MKYSPHTPLAGKDPFGAYHFLVLSPVEIGFLFLVLSVHCFSCKNNHPPLVVIATKTGRSHFLEGVRCKLWHYTNLLPIFLIKTFCFQLC